jgi:hypothetical protein
MLSFGAVALACFAGTAGAQGPKACDTCQDLCILMDFYQQKAKTAEIFEKINKTIREAESDGKALPPKLSTHNGVENTAAEEFDKWTKTRIPLNLLPCPLAPGGGGTQVITELTTDMGTCTVGTADANGAFDKPLVGPVLDAFEMQWNCKALTDTMRAHEEVHKRECENMRAIDPKGFSDFMTSPRMTAVTEWDAYTEHRDKLKEAINAIITKKGNEYCGWDESCRLIQDPSAIPTLAELQGMSKRAWQYSKALSDGGVTVPTDAGTTSPDCDKNAPGGGTRTPDAGTRSSDGGSSP